jgi:Leucine-rich repeat (LRR) protein
MRRLLGGLLLIASPLLAAVPQSERDALITFHDATGGPNWTKRDGWRGAAGTECTWHGVQCDESGANVVGLDLPDNNLTGAIPPQLANLPNLAVLSLSTNRLTGSIPPELGRLTKLLYLFLGDNQLAGTIPPQLFDATSLISFAAGYNQLTGPIPATVSRLQKLEELYLGTNQLSGPLTKELGDLPALRVVVLSSNRFSGPIPPELFRAPSLEMLDLGDNDLTGTIPREIANHPALRQLLLYSNELSGAIPIEVTTIANLDTLELGGNQFEGTIPPDLSRLTKLTSLGLGSNRLRGTIPAILGTLRELTSLGLSSNQLEGSIPSQLGDLTNLQRLSLDSNKLTGAVPDTFRNLKQLRELSLAGNALTGSVAWLGELTSLEALFAGANKFTGEIPASVANLSKLVFFDLAENDLTGPLFEFTNLKSLTYLRLSFNRLSGPLPASFVEATALTDVYIDLNRFTGPLPSGLGRLTKLGTLAIQGNLFEGTLPADLPPSLIVLSVHGNRLGGPIPKEIGRLTNLQFLDLSWSGFVGPVPVEITQLTSLQASSSDFSYNGLFTDDAAVRDFMNRKHHDGNWQGTQTVKPTNVRVAAVSDRSATIEWTPIEYTYDPGGYQVIASKTPGGAPAVIATTSGKDLNSIVVRNLEPSTTYHFTVATVTHPHDIQENLIVSDRTASVSTTTTARVLAPPDVVVTESTTGLVQIGGVAANEDSFTLTNFGDGTAQLSIAKDGDHFTLETDAITIAGAASRTIQVRSVSKPVGSYYGGAYVIGEGASDGIYIPVVLLSAARPAGSVIAEAVEARIEITGVPGGEQVGTARFRNSGTATLSGIVIADQPWVVPSPDPITIEPGQTATVNFRIVRSRRPQTEGALTATLSLVYVDGAALTAFQTAPSSGINISKVTIVDVTKPPVAPAQFGLASSGETAWFIPGIVSGLRGFGADLSILNGSSSRPVSDLRLYFSPAGGSPSVATLQPLGANQTITLTNVAANVYSAPQGAGTLQVRSAAGTDLSVLAKMTSLRPNGTFGGELPVFRADRAVASNEKLYLAGLRPTSDVIVQEVGGTATTVRIEFLDAAGAAAAPAQDLTAAALGMLEVREVAANAVTVVITNRGGGRLVAYARVTDAATGDGWSIVDWSRQNRYALTEAMRVPLAQRVTSTPGRGRRRAVHGDAISSGTTDLTLFNPTSAEVKAVVQVISANGRTSDREVTLAPLQTITLANVVTTTDAATAHVVITPTGRNAQVVVTARSSNTAVPVVGALEGLRVGQARSFSGLEDSTAFTTSYGFVETSGEPVRVRARLFLDKERSVVTAILFRDFDLPARGQIVVPELARSFGSDPEDLHNLRLQIEVIEGKGSVVPFVVVTDNGSGDASLRMQ